MADSKPTVAVIGASSDRGKFGNKAVRAHLKLGYDVYPVNPKGGEVEGLTAYTSIDDVPVSPLDRVSLYVPPQVGVAMLEAIAAKGCGELWLNPGTESAELIAKAESLGLSAIQGCSIVDLGVTPGEFGQ
ncbi:MAG: CoA-binding protein [Pirellulaceae bacterium]